MAALCLGDPGRGCPPHCGVAHRPRAVGPCRPRTLGGVDRRGRRRLESCLDAGVAGGRKVAPRAGPRQQRRRRARPLRARVTDSCIDAIEARRYFDAFVTIWDGHRQPVPLSAAGVRLTAGTLLIAVVWLRHGAAGLTADAAQLLRILAIASAGALAAAMTTHIPVHWLPQAIVVAMPGRFVNLTALMSCAVLIGLAANLASWGRVPYLLAATLVGLIVSRPSQLGTLMGLEGAALRPRPIDLLTMAALTASIAIWALVRRARTLEATDGELRATDAPRRVPRALAAAVLVAGLAVAGVTSLQPGPIGPVDSTTGRRGGVRRRQGRARPSRDSRRSSSGPAPNPAPSASRRQHPDVLPYSIEGAPQVARILRDLHGVDLFDPPAEARLGGRVPPLASRAAWTSRPRARWIELKRQVRRDASRSVRRLDDRFANGRRGPRLAAVRDSELTGPRAGSLRTSRAFHSGLPWRFTPDFAHESSRLRSPRRATSAPDLKRPRPDLARQR